MQRFHFYSKNECYILDYALEFLCDYSRHAKCINSQHTLSLCVCVCLAMGWTRAWRHVIISSSSSHISTFSPVWSACVESCVRLSGARAGQLFWDCFCVPVCSNRNSLGFYWYLRAWWTALTFQAREDRVTRAHWQLKCFSASVTQPNAWSLELLTWLPERWTQNGYNSVQCNEGGCQHYRHLMAVQGDGRRVHHPRGFRHHSGHHCW